MPLSDLSDREVDFLIGERCDPSYSWYAWMDTFGVRWRALLSVWNRRVEYVPAKGDEIVSARPEYQPPHYTASFDECLRVLRGMTKAQRTAIAESIASDLWLTTPHMTDTDALTTGVYHALINVTPRDICEAMLAAVGAEEV